MGEEEKHRERIEGYEGEIEEKEKYEREIGGMREEGERGWYERKIRERERG